MTLRELLNDPIAATVIPGLISAIVSALIGGAFAVYSTRMQNKLTIKAMEREERIRLELREEIKQTKADEEKERKERHERRKSRISPKFRIESIESTKTYKQQKSYLAFNIKIENTGGELRGAEIQPNITSTPLKIKPGFRSHSTETLRFTSEEDGHICTLHLRITGNDIDGDPIEISIPITWDNNQFQAG